MNWISKQINENNKQIKIDYELLLLSFKCYISVFLEVDNKVSVFWLL